MRLIPALLVFTLLLTTSIVSADEDGVDHEADYSGMPIESITHDAPSSDGVPWHINLTLNETAKENGTSAGWVSQICLKSGICLTPEKHQMVPDENNSTWFGEITPPEDHTYVRWRINLTYPDDTWERSDYGKTWSDDWEVHEVPENETPAISLFSLLFVIGFASILLREDN